MYRGRNVIRLICVWWNLHYGGITPVLVIRSGIKRIQKVKWLERFIEARERGITKENIISRWRGAGLFPENMHRILIQLTRKTSPQPPPLHTMELIHRFSQTVVDLIPRSCARLIKHSSLRSPKSISVLLTTPKSAG